VLDLPTRSGEVARVALVPFLSQRAIVSGEQLMSTDAAQQAGTYADRARRILAALTADFGSGDTVDVVAAHLTVASGAPPLGGGERQAHTIFDYVVPPQAFPASAHYVALGHLHLPHRVPGPAPTWYCGSPLHLDFGEADRGAKQVLLVDVHPDTPARVEGIPLRSGRRLLHPPRRPRAGPRTPRRGRRRPAARRPRGATAPGARRRGPRRAARTPSTSPSPDPRTTTTDRRRAPFDADDLRRSPVALFEEYLDEQGVADRPARRLFHRLLDETTDHEPTEVGA
jgi:DNA repair protein SbcD/Mre11